MKKLAILFSILVAALFVTPGLIGFKIQAKHEEVVARMQQNGLEVVSSDYRRGWFGSHVETKFKMAIPSSDKGESFAFTMLDDIVHGPLSPEGGLALASIGTSFQVDGKALFPEDENTVFKTNVGLDGSGETKISIPAMKLAGKPGRPEIQFSGAEGSILFDTSMAQASIDLKMPGLWVGGENGESLKFTETTLNSSSKAGSFGIFMGSGEFKVKQIDFENPVKHVAVKIDAVSFTGDTGEDEDNLKFNASYSVDAVTVNSVVYGPAQFEIGFENIPTEVAAKIQKGMQEVRGQGLSKDQESMAMMSLLIGAGPDLLKANPKMSIKRLFVKTPDGDIDGNLSIAANGLQWGEIGNLQAVLQKLEADAAISLPEKLLRAVMEMQAKVALKQQIEQRKEMGHEITEPSKEEMDKLSKEMTEQQLAFLLQQELVKRDGTNISSKAKLGSGLLSVNGKTVPLR